MITTSKKSSADEFRSDGGPVQVNIISVVVFVLVAGSGIAMTAASGTPAWAIVGVIVGVIVALSPRIARQWKRSVVLRLGRFVGLRGPGLFWIVPLVDSVTRTIDQRVIMTSFAAEQTLTSDTVPVNVASGRAYRRRPDRTCGEFRLGAGICAGE